MTTDLSLNVDSKTLEACLKTINNIGSTTYQNICTGTNTVVRWGQLDWFWFTLFLVVILTSGAVAYNIYEELKD